MAKGRTNKQGGASVSLTGDAVVAEVLNSKTFYNTDPNTKLTGTMPNKVGSATVITPSTSDQTIPQGYYGGASGDGKVIGDADLISANIKSGANIFGVSGNYAGGGTNPIGQVTYSNPSFGTYSGPGVVYTNVKSSSQTNSTTIPIFFKTSCVYSSPQSVTLDGISVAYAYGMSLSVLCICSTNFQYQFRGTVANNSMKGVNISATGVAYVGGTGSSENAVSIFFNSILVSDDTLGYVTIDGKNFNKPLLGYSY